MWHPTMLGLGGHGRDLGLNPAGDLSPTYQEPGHGLLCLYWWATEAQGDEVIYSEETNILHCKTPRASCPQERGAYRLRGTAVQALRSKGGRLSWLLWTFLGGRGPSLVAAVLCAHPFSQQTLTEQSHCVPGTGNSATNQTGTDPPPCVGVTFSGEKWVAPMDERGQWW